MTYPSEWRRGADQFGHYAWRQTRALEPGEPMHSGVRERAPGYWGTQEEADAAIGRANAESYEAADFAERRARQ